MRLTFLRLSMSLHKRVMARRMLSHDSEVPAEIMMARTNIPHLHGRIAVIQLVFLAGSAWAQTQPSSLNLQLPQQPDLRPELIQDTATPDEHAAGTDTSVHGSFTTGIGYSKAYGNSTVNAAELDVNKQYDNGKTLNLHIEALHSKGLPDVSPRDYVSRYPGY